MLLTFMIMPSFLLIFETAALKYYVTPNKTTGCSNDQQQVYFTNDTIFFFELGNHRLNSSLTLTNLHNLTFQGLPGNESVNVSLGSLVI